jgi:hypothetical protein
MSVLLTSPAFLLGLAAFADRARRRLVLASSLAIGLVALGNLMHFSQGWVQFGYRFSNDIVPFALVLVALGVDSLAAGDAYAAEPPATRRWRMPLAMLLIVASIAINAWGVTWGRILGW